MLKLQFLRTNNVLPEKLSAFPLVALKSVIMIGMISGAVTAQTLTDAEADRIVSEDMAALEARHEAMMPSFTVLESQSQTVGGKEVVIRRVVPPVYPEPVEPEIVSESDAALTPVDYSKVRQYEAISLGIRIFDETYSEIQWRGGDRVITGWSNVNFEYLTAFGEFEQDGILYALVAFLSKTTEEEELAREMAFAERGLDYEPATVPSPDEFSGTDPEYLVYTDGGGEIPEEFFTELDALHQFYTENEEVLIEAAQRRQALAEARTRYELANPEEDKPVRINFWKVRK